MSIQGRPAIIRLFGKHRLSFAATIEDQETIKEIPSPSPVYVPCVSASKFKLLCNIFRDKLRMFHTGPSPIPVMVFRPLKFR